MLYLEQWACLCMPCMLSFFVISTPGKQEGVLHSPDCFFSFFFGTLKCGLSLTMSDMPFCEESVRIFYQSCQSLSRTLFISGSMLSSYQEHMGNFSSIFLERVWVVSALFSCVQFASSTPAHSICGICGIWQDWARLKISATRCGQSWDFKRWNLNAKREPFACPLQLVKGYLDMSSRLLSSENATFRKRQRVECLPVAFHC